MEWGRVVHQLEVRRCGSFIHVWRTNYPLKHTNHRAWSKGPSHNRQIHVVHACGVRYMFHYAVSAFTRGTASSSVDLPVTTVRSRTPTASTC